MADTAAHLVDRVIPAVPVRQWVLSLPYWLRFRVAFDSSLMGEVLGVFLRAVFAWLRNQALENGIPNGRCGSVTSVQRFGSALNCHLHFHSVRLDGVCACAKDGEPPRFYAVRLPEAKDVAAVAQRVAMRVAALLEKRAEAPEPEEPEMADLYAASIAGRLAMGTKAGQKLNTFGEFREESFERNGSRWALCPASASMQESAFVPATVKDSKDY
jgi:hypothetical protein